MSDFQKHMERLLEDPELRAEYEALQPEMEMIRAQIEVQKAEFLLTQVRRNISQPL